VTIRNDGSYQDRIEGTTQRSGHLRSPTEPHDQIRPPLRNPQQIGELGSDTISR